MNNILWGIRQVLGPAILGFVVASIGLAILGTNIADRMGVPGVRLAVGYAVGLTLAGAVLGLGRFRLTKRSAARWIGTIAVFVMLVAILEIVLFGIPNISQLLLVGLGATLAPILAIPVVDGAWRRHFEQGGNHGSP